MNIGHREAQITNIGWKVGLFRKRNFVQTTIFDGMSSKIPVRLRDGEEANYYIPVDRPLTENHDWLLDFVKDTLPKHPKFQSHFLKVIVHTSVGKGFESKIEKGLRERLIKVAQEISSSVQERVK